MSQLTYRMLSDADKQEICSWHYEGEYAVHNLPSYEEMKAGKRGFLNPEREKNFYGFLDHSQLVGFVNIAEKESEVCIGIGVRPQLCGRGYGCRMLVEAYRISKGLYPGKPLYLEVRSWNKRAIRCYEKAGFGIEGEEFYQETHAGAGYFYRMVRK